MRALLAASKRTTKVIAFAAASMRQAQLSQVETKGHCPRSGVNQAAREDFSSSWPEPQRGHPVAAHDIGLNLSRRPGTTRDIEGRMGTGEPPAPRWGT